MPGTVLKGSYRRVILSLIILIKYIFIFINEVINKKDIDVNEHRPLPSFTIRQKLKLLFCSQDSYLVLTLNSTTISKYITYICSAIISSQVYPHNLD